MKSRLINPNLEFLRKCYLDDLRGVVLEGGSRSGKTWSAVDFIIWLCSTQLQGCTINIIRETYASFKTTLYDDFNRRMPMYGLPSPFAGKQEVKTFWLFSNKINFLGADSDTIFQGVGCDIAYFNEILDISNEVFDAVEQRCRRFWFSDFNPKFTDHWVFDKICNRKNVGTLVTTMLDNPHISKAEREKILSYDPSNPLNVQQGTADDFKWLVYGKGLRSAPEGLVFPYVTWVKEYPENIEKNYFGLDFGYTNSPTALTKAGVFGKRLFAHNLFYSPTPSYNELHPVLEEKLGRKNRCWADPSGNYGERGMIADAQRNGFKIHSTNTYPGSRKFSISILKKFELCLVDTPPVRKEQSNFRFKVVNGIRLDDTVDDYDHFWDSLRMIGLGELQSFKI